MGIIGSEGLRRDCAARLKELIGLVIWSKKRVRVMALVPELRLLMTVLPKV